VVKVEDGLHYVGDSVGAAAELPQEAPALDGGHGPLAEAADLGVGGGVAALPSLEAAASKGSVNLTADPTIMGETSSD
jgi:hypothetical protein